MKRPFQTPSILLSVVLALAGSSAAIAAPPSSRPETRHASGIVLIGSEAFQPRAKNKEQAIALDNARRLVRDNPNDLTYPWLDEQGVIVQRYVSAKGLNAAKAERTLTARREDRAERSYQQLKEIRSEIRLLSTAGVKDADTIWRLAHDYKHNRIIITVSKLSDSLMGSLAKRFGTEAIAVQVERSHKPQLASRQHEGPPFHGGARYVIDRPGADATCTIGFAWTWGYITAGHCAPEGGTAFGSWYGTMGGIASGVDENWKAGTGTMPFPDSTERIGDMALIRGASDRRAEIYVGPKGDSSTTKPVTDTYYRSPQYDDRICTSGNESGELCNWKVLQADTDQRYYNDDGSFEGWGLDLVTAYRTDAYHLIHGDSGGPVYVDYYDGTVNAVGIISGSGVDAWGDHYLYFTDIYDVMRFLPGFLLTPSTPPAYYLVNANSNKCLAIWNNANDDSVDATQWTCTHSQSQTWYLVPIPGTPWSFIKNGSGKCLSVDSNNPQNGALIHQWKCYESANLPAQRWIVHPDRTISNGYGKCLSVDSSSQANGAKILHWTCAGVPAQQWTWVEMNP